jgi:tetratricopeptide (TPR) repeat protein
MTFLKIPSTVLVVFLSLIACDKSSPGERKGVTVPAAVSQPSGDHALCTTDTRDKGTVDSTLREATRAATKRGDSADAWVTLGRAWVTKARVSMDPGFYLHANACASIALGLRPDSAPALDLRGLVYLNDHRFRDARELAERVLASDESDRNAWGILSDANLELGDLDGAERAAQRMMDLRPDLSSYARAAHLRWLRGDRKGAKLFGERAIRAGSESRDPEPVAWILVQTALVFWHEGDYAGADAGFDLALQRFDGYPPALVGKARVALAKERYSDAVRLLEAALSKSPSVETRWLLGDARLLAGDAKGAFEAFDRVVADGRRHDRRSLSSFYAAKKRDGQEAVDLARQELRERPGSYTKDALAWSLYRNGEYREARELAEQAISAGTPDARLLFHAGAIRIAAGDVTSGRELIRRALRLNPAFDPFESKEAEALVRS